MANLLLIKRRIKAAQNVSKTTRAMQLIAASKLKRAQEATLAGRPYAQGLANISQNLTLSLKGNDNTHPYLNKNQNSKKTLLIAFAPDKGLCGGLVTNLLHETLRFNTSNEMVYVTIGKKIQGIAKQNREIAASFKFGTTLPSYEMVYPISKIIDDYFLNKKVGNVKIISSHFVSIFSQIPQITNLLPIEFSLKVDEKPVNKLALFEPSPTQLLPQLLKHYVETQIYQNLLESYAAEQGARMIAMQNATDNAFEIIEGLQLEYNKERQEKITSEILDIGGASFTYAN